jgi:YfiR/HmsC-like
MFRASGPGPAMAQQGNDEYHVKAAFLFHFAQLVEWPSDASGDSGNSIFLCTLEDDAFSDELENTIEGRQIGSRAIRIRHVHLSQAIHGCNMLVIGKNEDKRLPSILATLRTLPVLTVGESGDFLNSGGIIRFCVIDNRLRFNINLAAADSSHLKISSQLLLLAASVTRGANDRTR